MKMLQEYIMSAMKKYYDNVAIITSEGQKISYNKMFEMIKGWYYLITEKYGENNKVLVKLKKTEDIIVVMIACMLSNNTFVPIDCRCTELKERLIKKSLGKYVIINEQIELQGNGFNIEKLEFDINVPTYVYYTSGTTGEPKAVFGRNTSLLHYILWEIEEFNIKETDRFGQVTNVMFDPFLRDVLVPILCGASIVIRPVQDILFSPRLFMQWMHNYGITCIHCTPTLVNMITKGEKKVNVDSLKYIFLAGEKVLTAEMKKWKNYFGEKTIFVNLYGPTETTLAKCYHIIDKNRSYEWVVPVGRPIVDEKIYILSLDGKECKNGECGEICIDMSYGSWGYIDGISSDKFEKNFNGTGQVLYHTGDTGYIDEGEIVVVGRKDRQVKINGVRIELDGIESILLKNDFVDNVAVVYKENILIVFIVLKLEIDKYDDIIQEQIIKSTSISMLKSTIIKVDSIEISENGKKDYKKMMEVYKK